MTGHSLEGKTALVTGASRGIGKAIAERLYAAGAKVAVVSRDEAKVRAVAAELGERAAGFAVDVSDGAAVAKTVELIEKALGPIDILVNNAGVTKDGLLVRMSDSDWDTVLDTNLKAAFITMKAVTRGMMKRRSGRVINIASVVGLTGNAGQANYAASKAGLIGLTKSVARELASRNVLVNAVAPGLIDTDMTRDLPEDTKKQLLAQIPLGRRGSSDDIAGAVLFLASDQASYITGQVLVVDGGMVT
ncbi:MAG: 3-oxoacyl-[acyl-carrier-protein] reductase [Gemmatimonadetes bacterium]|nr:3-oxoacyl-[acyl-carrier-protein] reductase [Gemmatimonadota bacterium]